MDAIELYSGKGFVQLVDRMGDQHRIIEAARVSYNARTKGPERDERLLHFLFRHKHHSPLEHVVLTFRIKAPIYVARQHMRHRVGWSYNELSRRYSSKVPEAYFAESDWGDHINRIVAHNDMERALTDYMRFVDDGVPSERARDVLPMATMTEYIATTNLRALLHFHSLRASPHAQAEIRMLAHGMYELTFDDDNLEWVRMAYELYGMGGIEKLKADMLDAGVYDAHEYLSDKLPRRLIPSVLKDL